MQKRAFFFFMLFLCLLLGVMMKVYALSSGELSQVAGEQASVTLTLGSAHGTIYDRHFKPLVNTSESIKASVAPYPQALSVLDKSLTDDLTVTLFERLRDGKPVVTELPFFLPLTDGLVMASIPRRYGGQMLAPHVIGYVGADGNGITGAEYVFNDLLHHYRGVVTATYTVDALGAPLEGVPPRVTDTLGNIQGGVVLTLDADIQAMAEAVAAKTLERGAILIMEPQSGDILAMVSVPSYQPDAVAAAMEQSGSPLVNRAMTNYNCGSIFKMVTSAAALEAGLTVEEAFTCNGSVTVDGITFHCHNLFGHGTLDMPYGFAKSCNPYYIQLAQKLGGERLYDMAQALGFTRAVSVAEGWQTARALLPSAESLQSPAELSNLAFGQGGLMATPVHIAQVVGAIVNDGQLVRPNLYYGTRNANGALIKAEQTPPQRVFSPQTAATLRQMMELSVEEGTGVRGKPFHKKAAAKTGTAETGWYENGQEVVQHWYAGYYPTDDPQYVLVVLSENMEAGGVRADPAFKQLCEELYLRSLTVAE